MVKPAPIKVKLEFKSATIMEKWKKLSKNEQNRRYNPSALHVVPDGQNPEGTNHYVDPYILWDLRTLQITLLDDSIFDFEPFAKGSINYLNLSGNPIHSISSTFMSKLTNAIKGQTNFFVLDLSYCPLTHVDNKATFVDFPGIFMYLWGTKVPLAKQKDITKLARNKITHVWTLSQLQNISNTPSDINVWPGSVDS